MEQKKVSVKSTLAFSKNEEFRTADLLGKTHTVLPAVMMVEGAYYPAVGEYDEAGSLHFSSTELKQSVNSWNGRPVAVNHPDNQATCNSPETFDKQWVGFVFNARYDEGSKSLKSDLWIDNDRGAFITNRVKAGEKIDVSIGAFGDLIPPLDKNVIDCDFLMTNLVGDHLAVLPDGVGACCWQDGCGIRAAVYEHPESSVDLSDNKKTKPLLKSNLKREVKSKKMAEKRELKADCLETVEVEKRVPVQAEESFDLDQWMSKVPTEVRNHLVNSMKNYDDTKTRHIESIASCKLVNFCREELGRVQDMALLERISALVEAKNVVEKEFVEAATSASKTSNYQLKASSVSSATKNGYAEFDDLKYKVISPNEMRARFLAR